MDTQSKGAEALKKLLKNPSREVKSAVRHGLFFFGRKVCRNIQNSILYDPKSGIIYHYRDKAGRRHHHRASAHGESPANWSGKLRKAAGFQVRGLNLEIGYRSMTPQGLPVPYARRLEMPVSEGGLGRSAIKNTIAKDGRHLPSFIADRINKELKK